MFTLNFEQRPVEVKKVFQNAEIMLIMEPKYMTNMW